MSEAFKLSGKIKAVLDAQTFASGFTKREAVVTIEDGQYSQEIAFEFLKDKVSLLDGVSQGDDVTIHFNIRGREWEGHNRWFNSLVCWKLEVAGKEYADDRPTLPPEDDSKDEDDMGEFPFG